MSKQFPLNPFAPPEMRTRHVVAEKLTTFVRSPRERNFPPSLERTTARKTTHTHTKQFSSCAEREFPLKTDRPSGKHSQFRVNFRSVSSVFHAWAGSLAQKRAFFCILRKSKVFSVGYFREECCVGSSANIKGKFRPGSASPAILLEKLGTKNQQLWFWQRIRIDFQLQPFYRCLWFSAPERRQWVKWAFACFFHFPARSVKGGKQLNLHYLAEATIVVAPTPTWRRISTRRRRKTQRKAKKKTNYFPACPTTARKILRLRWVSSGTETGKPTSTWRTAGSGCSAGVRKAPTVCVSVCVERDQLWLKFKGMQCVCGSVCDAR